MLIRLLFFALTFLSAFYAQAASYLAFDPSVQGQYRIIGTNESSDEEALLIHYYDIDKKVLLEEIYSISAKGKTQIPLSHLLDKTAGVAISLSDSKSVSIKAEVSSYGKTFEAPLAQAPSNSLILDLSEFTDGQSQLTLYNPTHVAAELEITLLSEELSGLQQLNISGHNRLHLSLGEVMSLGNEKATKLRIHSNVKLIALASSHTRSSYKGRLADAGDPSLSSPEKLAKAYFLIASPYGAPGSFVIALDKEDMIEHARKLVNKPEEGFGRIFIGRVDPTSGGYNRDFSQPASPMWSWHIGEAIEFSDFGSQKCDGTPQLVETHLPNWMKEVKTICFWDYTVIRELSIDEVQRGQLHSK